MLLGTPADPDPSGLNDDELALETIPELSDDRTAESASAVRAAAGNRKKITPEEFARATK